MDLVALMMNEVFLLLCIDSAEKIRTGLNFKPLLLNISVEIMQVLHLLVYLIGDLDSLLHLPWKFPVSK